MSDLRPYLCLPGRFGSRSEVVGAIRKDSGGLVLAGKALKRVATAEEAHVEVAGPVKDLEHAFSLGGYGSTLTAADLDAIRAHSHALFLYAGAGSVEGARLLLELGAGLVRAGCLAVRVETSGRAHSRADWLNLALAGGPAERRCASPAGGATAVSGPAAALYGAYVRLVPHEDSYDSTGMHALGLPDATVSARGLSTEAATDVLSRFLVHLIGERPALEDGGRWEAYRLAREPSRRFAPGHPFANPFGVWRLDG